MREIRLSGSTRGGGATVIGHSAFQSVRLCLLYCYCLDGGSAWEMGLKGRMGPMRLYTAMRRGGRGRVADSAVHLCPFRSRDEARLLGRVTSDPD